MKSPVANCSVMDPTSTFVVVLIYNLPQTKSVTNENIKEHTTGLSVMSMMSVYLP